MRSTRRPGHYLPHVPGLLDQATLAGERPSGLICQVATSAPLERNGVIEQVSAAATDDLLGDSISGH